MKKICLFLFALVFSPFEVSAQESGLPDVESQSNDWDVSMKSDTTIRAYNEKYEVELLFNISDLLPSSPQCVSKKAIMTGQNLLSKRVFAFQDVAKQKNVSRTAQIW